MEGAEAVMLAGSDELGAGGGKESPPSAGEGAVGAEDFPQALDFPHPRIQ
jgi:hypothetical protein